MPINKYKPLIKDISSCSIIETDKDNFIIQPLHLESQCDWGFIEWNVFELGNGDYCGFYWKIGCEDENPLVCALHHDEGQLLPWASSLDSFFRLVALNEIENEVPFKSNFWFDKEGLEDLFNYYGCEYNFKKIKKVQNLEDALSIDAMSPICLKYMGDRWRQESNFEFAKDYYLKALSSLPEYGDASFALAMLYRSQQQHNLAIPYFIDAFTAPFYFSKEQEKILRILRLYDDDSFHDNKDPIWTRRQKIKLDDGDKYPTFHHVLNEVIEEYLQLGEYRRVIGLRLFLGLFARADERLINRYQLSDHQRLLRKELEIAGLERRIQLLGL